jgi:hypothetical protein
MDEVGKRRLLVVEVPLEVTEAMGPFLGRASFSVEHVDDGAAALELLEHAPFHGIVVGHPLQSLSLAGFLGEVKRPGSNTVQSRILVVAGRDQRRDLDSFLGIQVDSVASPDDDPLALQHAVSGLLGVAPRKSVRIPVRVGVEVDANGDAIRGRTVDLSSTGALLESNELPDLHARVRFQLYLPTRPLAGEGRVVRHADPRFDRRQGFAIQFLSLEPDGSERIDSYLAVC